MATSIPAQTLGGSSRNLQLDGMLSHHIEEVSDFGAGIVSLLNKALIPSATANKVHKIIRRTFAALEDLDKLFLENQDTYVHSNRMASSNELKPTQDFFLRHEIAFPTREIHPSNFRVLLAFQERIVGTSKQIIEALKEKLPYFTEEAFRQFNEIKSAFTAAARSPDHATISSCNKRLESLEKEWRFLQIQFDIDESFEAEFSSRAEPLFMNMEPLAEHIEFALEAIRQERSLDAVERGSKESAKDLSLLFNSLAQTREYLINFERNVELPEESSEPDIIRSLRDAKGKIEGRYAELLRALLDSARGPIANFRMRQEDRLAAVSSQLSQDSAAAVLAPTSDFIDDEDSIKELIDQAKRAISENAHTIPKVTIELFLLAEEESRHIRPMLDLLEKKLSSRSAHKSETFLQLYEEVKKRERFFSRELTLPESLEMEERYGLMKRKLDGLLISLSQKLLHMYQADLTSFERSAQALIEAPEKDQAWIEAAGKEIVFLRDQFPEDDLYVLEEKDSKQIQIATLQICCRLQNEILNTKYKNLVGAEGSSIELTEIHSLIIEWSNVNNAYRAEMTVEADKETLALFTSWPHRIHELQDLLIESIRQTIGSGFIFLRAIDTSPKELPIYESISARFRFIEECEKSAAEFNEVLQGHEEKENLLKEMSYLFTFSQISKSFVELLFSEQFQPQSLKRLYPLYKQCNSFKNQVEREISEPEYKALFKENLAHYDAVILKALHRCIDQEMAHLGIAIVEPGSKTPTQKAKQALDYLVAQARIAYGSGDSVSRNARLQSLHGQVLSFNKTMRSFFYNKESARDIFPECRDHSINARNMILEYGMREAMNALDTCDEEIKRLISSDTSNEARRLQHKQALESIDSVIIEHISPYNLSEEDTELPCVRAIEEKYTRMKEGIETLFTDPALGSASTLSPYEPFEIKETAE